MNDWQMQNQLHGSPYSGCRCFTGWAKDPPGPKIQSNTCWPSPYNAPGAMMCVDRVQRPRPGPQNVQMVHYRPSSPYPRYVLGPGGDKLVSMPSAWTQKVGQPPYNLHPCVTGPGIKSLTFAIMQGNSAGGGPDFVVGSAGQIHSGDLGWS